MSESVYLFYIQFKKLYVFLEISNLPFTVKIVVMLLIQFQNERIGLGYIDLFLIHAPWGQKVLNADEQSKWGIRGIEVNGKPGENLLLLSINSLRLETNLDNQLTY